MDHKIIKHFQDNDPLLYPFIEKVGPLQLKQSEDYFIALCESIVSQQLSVKAADTIFARFQNLFPGKIITPDVTVEFTVEQLRSVGLSAQKGNYIKDLAQKVYTKEVNLNLLKDMDNEEVITTLTKIKGIGRWTAEMFLMFTLGRADIYSHGDLGLKNAVKKIYGLERVTIETVDLITNKWKPYRTYGCMILWKTLALK